MQFKSYTGLLLAVMLFSCAKEHKDTAPGYSTVPGEISAMKTQILAKNWKSAMPGGAYDACAWTFSVRNQFSTFDEKLFDGSFKMENTTGTIAEKGAWALIATSRDNYPSGWAIPDSTEFYHQAAKGDICLVIGEAPNNPRDINRLLYLTSWSTFENGSPPYVFEADCYLADGTGQSGRHPGNYLGHVTFTSQ